MYFYINTHILLDLNYYNTIKGEIVLWPSTSLLVSIYATQHNTRKQSSPQQVLPYPVNKTETLD